MDGMDGVTLVRPDGARVRFDGLVVYRGETVREALGRTVRETGWSLPDDGERQWINSETRATRRG